MNNLLNIKSFIKFLSRNKAYTAIDIFGLSVSLMFVILIGVYTLQELSTDNFHEKADRVYILGDGQSIGSAYRLSERIEERYPEIEKVCPVVTRWERVPVNIGEKKIGSDLLFADSTFFDVFSFRLKNGDPKQVLAAKNYAVISKSYAQAVFGNNDPIGQTLQIQDSVVLTVNGVMEDIRNSIIPSCDILVRIDNVRYFNSSLDDTNFSNGGGAILFILAKEGADLQTRATDMAAYFKEIFWLYQRGIREKVTFTPIREFYFSSLNSYGMLNQGNKTFVLILMSVGILILLFAIINYINLTVAQTGFRAKEMATRRLLGAGRKELFLRLMLESTLLTFVSFFLGLFLAFLFVPSANTLLETKLDLVANMTFLNMLIVFLLLVSIGGMAGLLPATVISSAKPIEVVRGSFRKQTKMTLSKVFITFQNVITIALIAASITMVLQVKYLINAPLGYNTENIMDISCYALQDRDQAVLLANELKRLPNVKRVGFGQGTPFDRGNNNTQSYKGKNISFQILSGDQTYFDMLSIEKLRDNHLANYEGYYLNQTAIKALEIEEDASSFLLDGWKRPIVIAGIVKDFQLSTITEKIPALMVNIRKTEDIDPWNIVVEVQGDPFQAREEVKKVYEQITHLDFDGKFVDQQIEEAYADQRRTSQIISIFAGIAILISLLGLIAMSTYFIQQRSKEIAVRKVFGSSNKDILVKLIFTFLNYVLIAFIIATPLIGYVMKRWLSGYSYRIELSPLIFFAAGLFCLLVSFVAVFVQSYYAANANPIRSIKDY